MLIISNIWWGGGEILRTGLSMKGMRLWLWGSIWLRIGYGLIGVVGFEGGNEFFFLQFVFLHDYNSNNIR